MTDDVILKALMTHVIADKYGMDSEELVRARALLAAGASEGQEPVAEVDESDNGIFVEIIQGPDGTPLKRGDKLYLHPSAEIAALRKERDELAKFVVAVGGFWGNIKSNLTDGETSLAACINGAFAECREAEALRERIAKQDVDIAENDALIDSLRERTAALMSLNDVYAQDIIDLRNGIAGMEKEAGLNLQTVYTELRECFSVSDAGKALKAVERAISKGTGMTIRRFRNKDGFSDSTDFIETHGSGMSYRVTRNGHRSEYMPDYEKRSLEFVRDGLWVEIDASSVASKEG